jgi:transcriptional regulator with XRE-family HTH domain
MLGQEIRERRERLELSQEALAAEANVHTNVVGRLERGKYNPSVTVLQVIVQELNADLAQIFAGALKRR